MSQEMKETLEAKLDNLLLDNPNDQLRALVICAEIIEMGETSATGFLTLNALLDDCPLFHSGHKHFLPAIPQAAFSVTKEANGWVLEQLFGITGSVLQPGETPILGFESSRKSVCTEYADVVTGIRLWTWWMEAVSQVPRINAIKFIRIAKLWYEHDDQWDNWLQKIRPDVGDLHDEGDDHDED